MFEKIEIKCIDQVEKLFNEKKTNFERKILANSTFYYCCGRDITPIIAFSHACSLFVYSDIIDYGSGNFKDNLSEIYQRLYNKGFLLKAKKELNEPSYNKKAEITEWADDKDKTFYLLFVECDSRILFRKLYSEKNNFIQPKCICNYRNEFSDGINTLNDIEKRAEFILGHCSNDKYEIVCDYTYHGDYGTQEKIPLHKRMYWYVY